MATLELRNLGKVYPNGEHAVHDLDISIADGELFVLVGPSGCGKTTALRMVAGLEEATYGDVVIDNVGGVAFPAMVDALRRGGRYATSGAIAGPLVELDLRTLYLRDLILIGCTGWDEPVFPNLVAYIERGEIRPVIAATFTSRHFFPETILDMEASGIPVLDGVVCAVKMAEAVVELGRSTSKRKTYRFPEAKSYSGEFTRFGSTAGSDAEAVPGGVEAAE